MSGNHINFATCAKDGTCIISATGGRLSDHGIPHPADPIVEISQQNLKINKWGFINLTYQFYNFSLDKNLKDGIILSMKNLIISQNPPKNTAGIYIILNTKTNDFYIGRSTNIRRRWYDHKYTLKANISGCTILQNAYNKYNPSDFIYGVLE